MNDHFKYIFFWIHDTWKCVLCFKKIYKSETWHKWYSLKNYGTKRFTLVLQSPFECKRIWYGKIKFTFIVTLCHIISVRYTFWIEFKIKLIVNYCNFFKNFCSHCIVLFSNNSELSNNSTRGWRFWLHNTGQWWRFEADMSRRQASYMETSRFRCKLIINELIEFFRILWTFYWNWN